jgi:hypothetical protein
MLLNVYEVKNGSYFSNLYFFQEVFCIFPVLCDLSVDNLDGAQDVDFGRGLFTTTQVAKVNQKCQSRNSNKTQISSSSMMYPNNS